MLFIDNKKPVLLIAKNYESKKYVVEVGDAFHLLVSWANYI